MENSTGHLPLFERSLHETSLSLLKGSLNKQPWKLNLETIEAMRTTDTVKTQRSTHPVRSMRTAELTRRVLTQRLRNYGGKTSTTLGILADEKPESATTRTTTCTLRRKPSPDTVISQLSFTRTPIHLIDFSSRASLTLSLAKSLPQASSKLLTSVITECKKIEKKSNGLHSKLSRLKRRIKRNFESVKPKEDSALPCFRKGYISSSVKTFKRDKKAFIYGPDFRGMYFL